MLEAINLVEERYRDFHRGRSGGSGTIPSAPFPPDPDPGTAPYRTSR
jgi:hypothetical protein